MEWVFAQGCCGKFLAFHSLCSVFAQESKFGGLLSLLLFVAVFLSGEFALQDYLNTHSAYLMALEKPATTEIELLCNAVYCAVIGAGGVNLTNGSSVRLSASASLNYTVQVVAPSDFESRRRALAFDSSEQYFSNLEQETEKFVLLSKTIDETYGPPPLETWAVQVLSTFQHYEPCAQQQQPSFTCGAYTLSFDNKVYVISHDLHSGAVIVLSAAVLSGIAMGLLIFLTFWCFRASGFLTENFEHSKKLT
jgi:hypothetical protein